MVQLNSIQLKHKHTMSMVGEHLRQNMKFDCRICCFTCLSWYPEIALCLTIKPSASSYACCWTDTGLEKGSQSSIKHFEKGKSAQKGKLQVVPGGTLNENLLRCWSTKWKKSCSLMKPSHRSFIFLISLKNVPALQFSLKTYANSPPVTATFTRCLL